MTIPNRCTGKMLADFPNAELMDISQFVVQGTDTSITADLLLLRLHPYLRKVVVTRHPHDQIEFDGVANMLHHTNVCSMEKEAFTPMHLRRAVKRCMRTFYPYWGLDGRGGAVKLVTLSSLPVIGQQVHVTRMNGEYMGSYAVIAVGESFQSEDGMTRGELYVDGIADGAPVPFKVIA